MQRKTHFGREFYKTALVIAIPIVIQNLISIGLNMADTIMIGKLGVDELAAVGTANRLYFVFSTLCFGVYSGAAVYVSQYWGVRDIPNIRRTFGIDLCLGGGISLLFMTLALALAPQILFLFTRDANVIELGSGYLRIVSLSYPLTAMSFAVNFNSRAIHNLRVPTLINMMALCINLVLNYGLIYGKLGMPQLGVNGAAIATLIARLVEFICMFVFIYGVQDHPLGGRPGELFSFDRKMFGKVLSTATPVIFSEGAWSLGNTVYYMAYGLLGASAIAVVQVASTINELFQTLFFGVGNASAVMIGNELGRRKQELAYDYAKFFLKVTLVLNIIASLGLYLSRGTIIAIYGFDAATNQLLGATLLVYALYMTPKMFTYVLFCGILRSGGDTKICAILDTVGVWFIGVPLAFAGVLLFDLSLPQVVALVFFEEIIKLGISFLRFRSKKWINTLID